MAMRWPWSTTRGALANHIASHRYQSSQHISEISSFVARPATFGIETCVLSVSDAGTTCNVHKSLRRPAGLSAEKNRNVDDRQLIGRVGRQIGDLQIHSRRDFSYRTIVESDARQH